MKSKATRNCRRKMAFPTEHRARVIGSLKMVAGTQWPYVCPCCERWHLTSQEQEGVTPVQPFNAGIFS